ncbi:MAG TPA: hypothetical protein VHK91_07690 [Flavisolibacter sp.]|jgi:hypothetical protein|nr:hypothetical protein [Flavisolibacter sp.]
MATSNITLSATYADASDSGILTRFMNWCKAQQPNRLLWLGIALSAHGCILTPLTVMTVLLAGTHIWMVVTALVAMGMALVTNLAALPTRITIPVFFLSVLMDVALVVMALAEGLQLSNTF